MPSEVVEGDTVWAELHYPGMRTDRAKHVMQGVIIARIQAEQIASMKVYIEDVKELH